LQDCGSLVQEPEPDGARAAPEVAGMEPGRSKRRALVFWLAAPLFFSYFFGISFAALRV